MGDTESVLEAKILDLLAQRDPGKTICPSDAARAAHAEAHPDDGADEGWRELMEPARQAARRLVAAGRLEITQGGEVVDPDRFEGPIRLRLPEES